jgi:DNA-binding NtrC family response regulator
MPSTTGWNSTTCRATSSKGPGAGADRPKSLRTVQHAAERDAIRQALEATGFNKARAAQMLGIHRSLFYKKLKKYSMSLQPAPPGRSHA